MRQYGSAIPWSASPKPGNWQRTNIGGFWQPMDTLREKNYLEGLWESGKAPWKVWQ